MTGGRGGCIGVTHGKVDEWVYHMPLGGVESGAVSQGGGVSHNISHNTGGTFCVWVYHMTEGQGCWCIT